VTGRDARLLAVGVTAGLALAVALYLAGFALGLAPTDGAAETVEDLQAPDTTDAGFRATLGRLDASTGTWRTRVARLPADAYWRCRLGDRFVAGACVSARGAAP
jgi:hypothetical protein